MSDNILFSYWPHSRLRVAAKSIILICYIFASEITESESQCLNPETNQWTGFKVSINEMTRNLTVSFWCLEEENDANLILHQINNNNKDVNEKGAVVLCDPISKEWVGPFPLCFPTCVPPNGKNLEIELDQLPVIKNRFLMGTQARFSCKEGSVFTSTELSVARCNEGGRFDHHPKCVATCNGKEMLAHETYSEMKLVFNQPESSFGGRFLAGTEVTYSCTDESTYIHGAKSAICQDDGSWLLLSESTQINLKPYCMPTCAELPLITDAALNVSLNLPTNSLSSFIPAGRYPLASIAHFNCFHPHHVLIGSTHLHCVIQNQKNTAEWNDDDALPHCETTCGAINLTENKESALFVNFNPPVITDHSKTSLNGRYSANTVATFSCRNNNTEFHRISFKMKETLTMKCQNGAWTSEEDGQLPKCDINKAFLEVVPGTEMILFKVFSPSSGVKGDEAHTSGNNIRDFFFLFICIFIFIAILLCFTCWQSKGVLANKSPGNLGRLSRNKSWRDFLKTSSKLDKTTYTNILGNVDSNPCISTGSAV